MATHFLTIALIELQDAVRHYDDAQPGLGGEFLAEVVAALGRIEQYPLAWQRISRRTRRCCTRRFPYGILYQVRDRDILIVSVFHLHRAPNSWRQRLPPPPHGA